MGIERGARTLKAGAQFEMLHSIYQYRCTVYTSIVLLHLEQHVADSGLFHGGASSHDRFAFALYVVQTVAFSLK